ncbi:hypothetical protein D3C74_21820 [compost metagenome]
MHLISSPYSTRSSGRLGNSREVLFWEIQQEPSITIIPVTKGSRLYMNLLGPTAGAGQGTPVLHGNKYLRLIREMEHYP